MKECLQCKKEFKPKRERAKFCSDLCRATFHQNLKTAKSQVTDDKEVAKLYTELMKIVKNNNKPENKARILAERNEVKEKPDDKAKRPLSPKEAVNKPIEDRPVRMDGEDSLD